MQKFDYLISQKFDLISQLSSPLPIMLTDRQAMQSDIKGIEAYQQKENDMANRGRPKGTKYPDGKHLDRMADLLLQKQVKTANAAIMKVAKEEGIQDSKGMEAFRRRLHDKWRVQKNDCMSAARERQAERIGKTMRKTGQNIAAQGRALHDSLAHIANPLATQMREIKKAGVFDQIARGLDTGVFAQVRDLQQSGIFAQMQDLQQSGIFAHVRDLEKSSLSGVMRDLERSNIFEKFEIK